jgi:L-ascorbate metabolism protein UlaG (beta-lactamase superfamily)
MKITKYGHCCLLIEEGGLRVLTDPGSFSSGYEAARNVDVILITHEHSDHFHLDSLKTVLANNPQARVVTNSAVGALMGKENLAFEVLEHGQSRKDKEVLIEGIGTEHAVIYPTLPNAMNTGYFIGGKLFYPGDALTNPNRPVEILALPVTGPWMKISDALDYAIALKPKIWLPVHDGNLKSTGFLSYVAKEVLEPAGLAGVMPENGKGIDF